jgi:hypothetical protein
VERHPGPALCEKFDIVRDAVGQSPVWRPTGKNRRILLRTQSIVECLRNGVHFKSSRFLCSKKCCWHAIPNERISANCGMGEVSPTEDLSPSGDRRSSFVRWLGATLERRDLVDRRESPILRANILEVDRVLLTSCLTCCQIMKELSRERRVTFTAVNSADDQINPPELKIIDVDIQRVKQGRYVLLPISDSTRGHGTHSLPAIWGNYLKELLERSGGR